jgi:hypothetical protein
MRWLRQIVVVFAALVAAAMPWLKAQTTPVTGPNVAFMRSLPAKSDLASFPDRHHFSPNRVPLFPFGLFSGSLFPDNAFPADSSAASQSPLNLIEALSALSKNQASPPPPASSQPLLIELQGDRYVRINSGETAGGMENYQGSNRNAASMIPPKTHALGGSASPGNQFAKSRTVANQQAQVELPPAVLIFRDGHNEEVRDYTIVDGILYARGDYYTDGYWNRKVQLTALNLPETLKFNEARGVHFVLPNAPNEVVTRP